jgi:hypothetical protein
MRTQTANFSLPKILLTDILILTLVYFIPALSHVMPIPVYLLDPMRLLLLTGFLLSRNNTNALLLAATIPLISTIATGHPPFYKAILISIELVSNITLFVYLIKKLTWSAPILLLISIIASKIIYYTFKYLFIQLTLIEGALITTDLFIQLATVGFIVLMFWIFYRKINPTFDYQ